ncbi:MAG TPA: hypothetical protein VFE15_12035 [Marmoricola sp.]|jgi:hypothetical protein|nr:hypothetical protein [Marmoricola sp.]
MPRVIDYSRRIDAIRETVYDLTLAHGPHAVTIDTVASVLLMSGSTIRRILNDPAILPRLGLDHVARRRQIRSFARARPTFDLDERWAAAVAPVLGMLPLDEEERQNEAVWRALVACHAQTAWAREAIKEHEFSWAIIIDRALPETLPTHSRRYEYIRLHALVVGAVSGILAGSMGPDEALNAVRQHLDDLYTAWLGLGATGAA